MELKRLLAIYRRALLEVISIANLWVYLGFDQCCFLGSESDVYLRSLYWWFLVIAVCLLQAGIPGNLHTVCPSPDTRGSTVLLIIAIDEEEVSKECLLDIVLDLALLRCV
jgi:hypothetical protein